MIPAPYTESLPNPSSTGLELITRVNTAPWNIGAGNACSLYPADVGIRQGDRNGIIRTIAYYILQGEPSGGKPR